MINLMNAFYVQIFTVIIKLKKVLNNNIGFTEILK